LNFYSRHSDLYEGNLKGKREVLEVSKAEQGLVELSYLNCCLKRREGDDFCESDLDTRIRTVHEQARIVQGRVDAAFLSV